jgi:hypothetical protein
MAQVREIIIGPDELESDVLMELLGQSEITRWHERLRLYRRQVAHERASLLG